MSEPYIHALLLTGKSATGRKSGLYLTYERYVTHEERWARRDFADRLNVREICTTYLFDTEHYVRNGLAGLPICHVMPPELSARQWAWSNDGKVNSVTLTALLECIRSGQAMDWICVQTPDPKWMSAAIFAKRLQIMLAHNRETNMSGSERRIAA